MVGDELVAAYVTGAVGAAPPGRAPRGARRPTRPCTASAPRSSRRAFAAAGFPPLAEVAEQVEPDPDFPTVAFPNPEEPGALDLALARAAAVDADLVLANDPDADRLAVAVPTDGGWRPLSGDELGALLGDHVLRTAERGAGDVVVTTIVSSSLLGRIAAAAGAGYAEALTGFKWVVRAPGPGQRFLFGYEEALGYCVDGLVRDKDGIGAALVAAELVAGLRAQGGTLLDRLDDLHRRHGVHATAARSRRVEGADWLARVTAAMAALRDAPPGGAGPPAAPRGRGPAARRAAAALGRADLARRRRPRRRAPERHRAEAEVLRRGGGAGWSGRRPRATAGRGPSARRRTARVRRRAAGHRRPVTAGQAVPNSRSPASPSPGTM